MIDGLKGIITPLVTPIKDGKINEEYTKILLEFIKNEGVVAAFPMGSTGLFPFFSFDQHLKMIEYTAKNLPTGLKLLAGSSRNNSEETLELAKKAKDVGVDVVVIVTPYYVKLSQESIKRYYYYMATYIDSDIMVYNIPQFTCNSIRPETLASLMEEHSNIIGIKDSSGDMKLFQGFIQELPKRALVFQGSCDLLLSSVYLGASGGVCAVSNYSDLVVQLYRTRSTEINRKVTKIIKLLALSESPKVHYYLFFKTVLKIERPKNYMPFPIEDLKEEQEVQVYKEFLNI